MKKFLQLLFCFILVALNVKSQDKRINVDYQYIRAENEYHAYNMFVKIDDTKSAIEFEFLTTHSFDKLQSVAVKNGEKLIQLPFSAINFLIKTDDENLKSLLIVTNMKSILTKSIDCETTIYFAFLDGKRIALPFRFCLAKEKLKTLNL